MDDDEHISNRIQIFYGINYAYWSDRVKTYLTNLGVDIWHLVVNGYVIPKSRHVILGALAPTIARKVMGCSTAK
jgi:hypothetical protein